MRRVVEDKEAVKVVIVNRKECRTSSRPLY